MEGRLADIRNTHMERTMARVLDAADLEKDLGRRITEEDLLTEEEIDRIEALMTEIDDIQDNAVARLRKENRQ